MDDNSLIENVAKLARVEIAEKEKSFLGGQLTKILGYVDKLKALNVDSVEPMRGLHPESQVLREDLNRLSGLGSDILQNAPASEGNCFKVPPVIE